MNDEVMLVKRCSVAHAMGNVGKGCAHGEGYLFGDRRGAQDAQRPHNIMPTAHAVDESRVEHTSHQVTGGRRRSASAPLGFLEGEMRLASGD
jgi:hypothetical protein